MINIHTFLRRAAQELPWDGRRFGNLFGYLSGLVPDTIGETHRQLARLTLPLPFSPTDVLPYLARDLGVPLYAANDPTTPTGYAATLAQLQSTVATHRIAGSMAGLVTELVRAGLAGADIRPSATHPAQVFDVGVTTSNPPRVYGTASEYGDGYIFGRQVSAARAAGLLAVMRYFRPAGARFRELVIA